MKTFVFLMFGVLFFLSCNAQKGYRLEGNLNGFEDGCKVSIALAATHKDEKPEALTILKNGAFVLTGQLEEPRLYRLIIEDTKGCSGSGVFMLENGHVLLQASRGNKLTDSYMELKDFVIIGSDSDNIYRQKMLFRDSLDQMYKDMHDKFREYNNRLNAARQENNETLVRELTTSETAKAFSEAENHFFETVTKKMNENFRKNSDSFWGPLLVLNNVSFFPPDNADYISLYEGFSDEAKNSFYGRIMKEELFPESLKGKKIPQFVLLDQKGKEQSIDVLRKGKKCVLIDFWASWCSPCRKSIPLLKEIYKDFASRGLEIISISIDKKNADWLKALDEEQLPWFNLHDTKDVFGGQFHGRAIPALFLVDVDGKIVAENLNVNELRAKIEEQLAK